jgi:hypothetical protein
MFRCRCGKWFPDNLVKCPACETPIGALDEDQLRDLAAQMTEDAEDLQDMRAERGDGLTRRNGRP